MALADAWMPVAAEQHHFHLHRAFSQRTAPRSPPQCCPLPPLATTTTTTTEPDDWVRDCLALVE